jgi:mRNA interferase YafQ
MYKLTNTNQYKKDLKRIASHPDLVKEINNVVRLLATDDTPLPEQYRDHPLKGKYAGFRECHIRPDWLLVYKKEKNELVLMLVRTGSHSYIF